MISKKLNEELTRVGKGTPGGEMLRHYWQPFALATDVDETNSIKKKGAVPDNYPQRFSYVEWADEKKSAEQE